MLSAPPHYLCRVGGVGGEVVPRWSRAGRWVRWVRWAGGWERARDRDRHSTKTKVPSELGVSAAALDGECGSAWRRRQCRSARREGGVLHAFVLWSRDLFTGSSCCTGRGQTKSKKCNQTDEPVKKSSEGPTEPTVTSCDNASTGPCVNPATVTPRYNVFFLDNVFFRRARTR